MSEDKAEIHRLQSLLEEVRTQVANLEGSLSDARMDLDDAKQALKKCRARAEVYLQEARMFERQLKQGRQAYDAVREALRERYQENAALHLERTQREEYIERLQFEVSASRVRGEEDTMLAIAAWIRGLCPSEMEESGKLAHRIERGEWETGTPPGRSSDN